MAPTGTGEEGCELQKGQVLMPRAILIHTISAVRLPSQAQCSLTKPQLSHESFSETVPGTADQRARQRNPWILGSAQFTGTPVRGRALQVPCGPGKLPGPLDEMMALSVLPIQGADGQRSGVVGTNAVARTKIGQEAPREGIVGESENVGAIISHIVEGDIMGLIIQEDAYPAGRDQQGQERVFIGACPVFISLPQPYHPESIVGG